MNIRFLSSISEVSAEAWNRVVKSKSPFLRYEFMRALEDYNCVGENQGWLPFHQVAEDDGQLIGVMPLYIKYNSYGELVFDWSWAEAFERTGRQYYPKLVAAVPYTPVTGRRLYVIDSANEKLVRSEMIKVLIAFAQERSLSSIHCLFPDQSNIEGFESQHFVTRLACQFHWQNRAYGSFEHFLSFFTSRKRKNILRERRAVVDQHISFQTLQGDQIEEDLWPLIYQLYQKTFFDKGGYATFSLEFFKYIGRNLGDQLIVFLAVYKGEYVAAAICYKDETHLYGRHWGWFEEFDKLHFEACYYQGLEFAIEQGLSYFDPGAQGEHKISRGFLPTETWSCHWINDSEFSGVIKEFVIREKQYMRQYIAEMSLKSPYKTVT